MRAMTTCCEEQEVSVLRSVSAELVGRVQMVKVGGSVFDAGARVVADLCRGLAAFAASSRLVVGVGGGPPLEVVKRYSREFGLSEAVFEQLAVYALAMHAEVVAALIPGAVLVANPSPATIAAALEMSQVVVLGPASAAGASWSDASLLRIADGLGLSEAVFIKDTPGVFRCVPDAVATGANAPIRQLSLDVFRRVVCRIGHDGVDEHLIESAALDVLEHAECLERVVFLDCRDPTLVATYAEGQEVGSVLYKRPLARPWLVPDDQCQ